MEGTMTTGQAARLPGITVKTLQRWEREGRLVPATRTASNGRRYTESHTRVPAHGACRSGYDWFAHYAALHGCELLVLNQQRLSPEQEVAQDLMTIVHCFSSRLYGLRNYRRRLRAALESDHAAGAPDQD
jgi:predicted site-specific integrase-resolvase